MGFQNGKAPMHTSSNKAIPTPTRLLILLTKFTNCGTKYANIWAYRAILLNPACPLSEISVVGLFPHFVGCHFSLSHGVICRREAFSVMREPDFKNKQQKKWNEESGLGRSRVPCTVCTKPWVQALAHKWNTTKELSWKYSWLPALTAFPQHALTPTKELHFSHQEMA